jgi:hypothetical protein
MIQFLLILQSQCEWRHMIFCLNRSDWWQHLWIIFRVCLFFWMVARLMNVELEMISGRNESPCNQGTMQEYAWWDLGEQWSTWVTRAAAPAEMPTENLPKSRPARSLRLTVHPLSPLGGTEFRIAPGWGHGIFISRPLQFAVYSNSLIPFVNQAQ